MSVPGSRLTASLHDLRGQRPCETAEPTRTSNLGGYSLHRLLKFLSPGPFLRLVTASLMFAHLRKTTNKRNKQTVRTYSSALAVRGLVVTQRPRGSMVCLLVSLCFRVRTEPGERGDARAHTSCSPPPPLPAPDCGAFKPSADKRIKEEIIDKNLRRHYFFVAPANRKIVKHVDLKPQNDWLSRLSVKFRFFSLSGIGAKRLQDRLKEEEEEENKPKQSICLKLTVKATSRLTSAAPPPLRDNLKKMHCNETSQQ